MVVYIPNDIYEQCKLTDESMEEFIKTVIWEWVIDNLIPNEIIEKAIESISIIDNKFGT